VRTLARHAAHARGNTEPVNEGTESDSSSGADPVEMGHSDAVTTGTDALAHAIATALADLTRPARTAMAALGLLGRPANAALLGPGLAELVEAGLVSVEEPLVRPVSPYVAEVAAGLLDRTERAALHRHLAELVPPRESARHLAAAGEGGAAYRRAVDAATRAGTRRGAGRAVRARLRAARGGAGAGVRLRAAQVTLAVGWPQTCVRALGRLATPEAAVLRGEALLQMADPAGAAAAVAGVPDDAAPPVRAVRDRLRLLAQLATEPAAALGTARAVDEESLAAAPGLRAAVAAVYAAHRVPGWERGLAGAAEAAGGAGDVTGRRWCAWLLVETLLGTADVVEAAAAAQAAATACAADLAYSWQTRFLAARLWCLSLHGAAHDEVVAKATDLTDRTLPSLARGYALAAAGSPRPTVGCSPRPVPGWPPPGGYRPRWPPCSTGYAGRRPGWTGRRSGRPSRLPTSGSAGTRAAPDHGALGRVRRRGGHADERAAVAGRAAVDRRAGAARAGAADPRRVGGGRGRPVRHRSRGLARPGAAGGGALPARARAARARRHAGRYRRCCGLRRSPRRPVWWCCSGVPAARCAGTRCAGTCAAPAPATNSPNVSGRSSPRSRGVNRPGASRTVRYLTRDSRNAHPLGDAETGGAYPDGGGGSRSGGARMTATRVTWCRRRAKPVRRCAVWSGPVGAPGRGSRAGSAWDVSESRLVLYGRVIDVDTAQLAVHAAARGAGVVAIADESSDVGRALLGDLRRLGPVVRDPEHEQISGNGDSVAAANSGGPRLLPEQRALLDRLANGETIAAAAAAEYLSLRTANRRIAQARDALGVRTTREAGTDLPAPAPPHSLTAAAAKPAVQRMTR